MRHIRKFSFGFTLIEMLIGLSLGIVTLMAIMTLLTQISLLVDSYLYASGKLERIRAIRSIMAEARLGGTGFYLCGIITAATTGLRRLMGL